MERQYITKWKNYLNEQGVSYGLDGTTESMVPAEDGKAELIQVMIDKLTSMKSDTKVTAADVAQVVYNNAAHWMNKTDIFNNPDAALSGYMFIGDSLSSKPGGGTWNGILDKSYNLGATHVYLSGCTTKWMKSNAIPIITSNPGKFKKVVIWGGTNDAFNNDTGSTISNLTAISKAVKAAGGQLYVFLGYDAAKVMINLGDGNRYCDNKCRKLGKARTIDLFKQIEGGISGAIIIPRVPGGDENWAPKDGVHISGPAHGKIASHIWPYIKP